MFLDLMYIQELNIYAWKDIICIYLQIDHCKAYNKENNKYSWKKSNLP